MVDKATRERWTAEDGRINKRISARQAILAERCLTASAALIDCVMAAKGTRWESLLRRLKDLLYVIEEQVRGG